MPRLSDTMEEGTILRWLKHDGEHVKRGEELVEIETDKAAMTYESDSEGTLQTVAREGDTLAVGEPIARIGAQDANGVPASQEPVASEQTPPAAADAPSATRAAGADRAWGAGEGVSARPPHRARERCRSGCAQRQRARRTHRQGRRGEGRGFKSRPRYCHRGHPGGDAVGGGGVERQGRDHHRRAVAHAAHDRAAHGRVEGHDPRLHADRGHRHGALRRTARRAEAALARRTRPPTTT